MWTNNAVQLLVKGSNCNILQCPRPMSGQGGMCCAQMLQRPFARAFRETSEWSWSSYGVALSLSLVSRLSRSSLWASRPSWAPLKRRLCRQP